MKINIDEMPENKTFDDYPPGTKFVFRECFPRFDREALKNGEIIRIYPDDQRYENAVTREELRSLAKKQNDNLPKE